MPIQAITPTFNSWNAWPQYPAQPTPLQQFQNAVDTRLNNFGNAAHDYIANNPPYLGRVIDVMA